MFSLKLLILVIRNTVLVNINSFNVGPFFEKKQQKSGVLRKFFFFCYKMVLCKSFWQPEYHTPTEATNKLEVTCNCIIV